MAMKLNMAIIDDIDGSPGAELVFFRFNGQGYEIDLSPVNRQRMRDSLQPFIDAGRRIGQRNPVRATQRRAETAAIRSWAAGQGIHVAETGRLSSQVIRKYKAAH